MAASGVEDLGSARTAGKPKVDQRWLALRVSPPPDCHCLSFPRPWLTVARRLFKRLDQTLPRPRTLGFNSRHNWAASASLEGLCGVWGVPPS